MCLGARLQIGKTNINSQLAASTEHRLVNTCSSAGSEALPAGSEAIPPGSEALSAGSHAQPVGSKALPVGCKALPTGSEAHPAPSEGHPALSETLPAPQQALHATCGPLLGTGGNFRTAIRPSVRPPLQRLGALDTLIRASEWLRG